MDNGQPISFTRPDGQQAPGVFFPGPAGAPGVVLIQEWWGINDQIRRVGARLASAGYRVVIPDLYRGRNTTRPDEANHLMQSLDFADAVRDLAGALAFLQGQDSGARVGVSGFCMGGALTIAALANIPGFAAGVCFYGIPPHLDLTNLRAPLQAHFATRDGWCTPAAVQALEDKLREAHATYELYNYEADHAFFNEARPEVYVAAAAAEAWRRTLDFFHRHLGGPAHAAS